MIEVTDERDLYLADFERFAKAQEERSPTWAHSIRRSAIERFAKLGFPTIHDEEWRFTNVAALAKVPLERWGTQPSPVTPASVDLFKVRNCPVHLMVFVNGRFSPALSSIQNLPSGVQLVSLATALQSDPQTLASHLARYASYEEHAFVALNTAFIEDGAFINIPRGVVVELPIHLLFLSTNVAKPLVSHPRNLIVAGPNSQASIVETYAGWGEEIYFTNAVTEVVLNDNAFIDHYKL